LLQGVSFFAAVEMLRMISFMIYDPVFKDSREVRVKLHFNPDSCWRLTLKMIPIISLLSVGSKLSLSLNHEDVGLNHAQPGILLSQYVMSI